MKFIKMLRIVVLLVIGTLLFSCFRKKKHAVALPDWLERHFPGRFEIVDTWAEDPIRNLTFKMKKSVVAERADSLLQIEVRWDKREQPDLGLSSEKIASQFEEAKAPLADARALFSALKSAGFSQASAAIRHGDAMILVFETPTAAARKQVLSKLKTALATWPAAKNYGLDLMLMEPGAYQKEFGDIVPLSHWLRRDSWQSRKTTLSMTLPEGYDFPREATEKAWEFNTESDLLLRWLEKARPLAERWATTHFKQSVVVADPVEFWPLREKLGAAFKLPIKFSAEGPSVGYVVGEYFLDSDSFEGLRFETD